MERKITTKITALLFTLLISCLSYAQPCATTGITAFAPTSGPASTVVTISGTGFQNGSGVSAILFNGFTSSGFTVVSNTQIKAVVPQNATSGAISVVMSDCTATTPIPFTVFSSTCPALPGNDFSAQPLSQAICEGSDAQYTASSNSGAGLTYQWKMLITPGTWVSLFDDAIFSGTNTPTLSLTNTPATYNGAQFYCESTSATCILVSNATQLTVSSLPVVVMLPTQPNCLIPTGSLIIMPLVGDNLSYSINGTDFQSLALFSNLTPGSYLLTVKTSAGCTTAMPFTINTAPQLPAVANVTVTQPDCNGVTTGSIIVNSPIDLGLTYSIDGINFQSGTTFNNLAPGTYTVTVSTALGCVSISSTVTINQAPTPPVAATTVVAQPDCDTLTGTITITAPIGAGLTYSIDGINFQNGTTFANLSPGQYNVNVQGTGGCTSQSVPVTINAAPIAPAVATTTVIQPTCTVTTGTITITSPLGLAYSIDGINFQNGTTFANLATGQYTVTVQGTGGCTSQSVPVTINTAPIAPAVATTTVAQPTCTVTTGTITITAPTGPGLTYSIDGVNFQNGTTFANLAPGQYNITVQGTGGCTSQSVPVTINTAPIAPAVATTTVAQPTCTISTGTITITAPTAAGLTYSIDGINFQNGTTFTNLAPGQYNVTVQGTGGCTSQSVPVTINAAPIAPAIAITIVAQPTCTVVTGTITITAPLGLAYSIDGINFQNGTTFANLAPGQYTVTVQGTGGCTSQSVPVTINAAPIAPAVATTTVTQPTCTVSTGTITITSPLGLAYSINGINFQNGTTFTNLAPGQYNVTVQGTSGCTSQSVPVTINAAPIAPAVATTTVAQPTCTVVTGTITITAPLGLAYSIDGINFQNGTTFANLAPGQYTVTVQGTGGCTSQSAPVTINVAPIAPAIATTTITQPTCTVTTGTVTITAPLGLAYSIDGVNFQNGTTFANLAPGQYNVTVQGTSGCTSQSVPVTINAAPIAPSVATTTVTQPTCTVSTGTITITSPLGLAYSIDGVNFQNGTTFTNLAPGQYTVTVQGTDGCTSQSVPVTINAAPIAPAVATTTVTQPTCTVSTGTITITSPLGLAYSIDGINFQNGTTFTNLAPGQYNVTVQGTGGCTSQSVPVTINAAPIAPSVATTTVAQPTCILSTGTITITAPLGLAYSIDGINFQNGTTFANLAPGQYNITVQGTGGCTSQSVPVTINAAPIAPAIATTTVAQPTCTVSTGTITITAPLGLAYSIDGINFQNGSTFANLAPGQYTVTVQGTGGCTSQSVPVTINAAPTAPAVATTTVAQPTCTVTTGTITITAPTGAGLTYSIDGINFQNGTTFANLAPGQYNITVQGTGGCTSQSVPVTINAAPIAPAIATVDVTQPTCTSTVAKIVVTAPIGNGFTYSIDGTNFQTNPTFANLTEGNYTVTTQNVAGCISETLPVTINAAPVAPAVPTYTVANATCTTKGSITLTASSQPGLTYSIDGTTFQTGLLFADLDPGAYTITVMNADGCTAQTGIITLNPVPDAPAEAVVNLTQPVCNGAVTGTITITSPIGTGLTYSIDGGVTYQSGTTFADVAIGTYTVMVQNAAGCTSESALISIVAPVTPDVATYNFTQPDCTTGGSITVIAPLGTAYTFSIDGINYQAGTMFTNLAGGNYLLTVMGQGGCTSVTTPITINNSPAPAVATTTVTQPNCDNNFGVIEVTSPLGTNYTYSIDGGLTYQTNPVFISLAPNTYTVTVSGNGCTSVTQTITLNSAPGTPATPTVSIIQPTCSVAGGTIVVGGFAGTSGNTFSIDGTNYQTANSFPGLAPGIYSVTVRNDGGCTSAPVTATISPASGEILLTSTEGCKSITLGSTSYMLEVMLANNNFDINDLTIKWTDTNGNVVGNNRTFNVSQYVADNTINREDYPLQFTATVTTPDGCEGTIAFTVENAFCDIPKGISPNSDGMNDNFDISGINASKLSIFNRHGKEVYSRNAYKNEWYGQTDNDEELPTGTYYYVIDTNGGSKTGWVYINRQD